MSSPVRRVLVANRGEIAVRVVRACFDEGVESVVAVSAADVDSLAARRADRSVVIGPASAADSYLSIDRVLAAAKLADCDALHPGYGFLSERPELAEACEEEGIVFVGPSAAIMRRSGDKLQAREAAEEVGVPTGGGSSAISDLADAVERAEQVGYPLMLKASAGGGGRGMAVLRDEAALRSRYESSRAEAQQAFGDGRLYVERYVERARHVEVQILADRHGNVVHLGERDCSCQRRAQKLVEESPAVDLPEGLVDEIRDSAVRLCRHLEYVGAATVEFLVDRERGDFVFLEINARVQVEHPVTEMVTGIDIVREQLRIAGGAELSFRQEDVVLTGHAIECRVNAEDPAKGFVPGPGTVRRWLPPEGAGIRVDTHLREGDAIPPYYDSLLAKLIVHADDRPAALALVDRALGAFEIEGVPTTVPIARAICADADFGTPVTTRWLEDDFLPRWTPDPHPTPQERR